MITRILNRTKRAKREALAARYDRVAETYGQLAEQAERTCPRPKDVPFVKYAEILQGVYENHAEDIRKL